MHISISKKFVGIMAVVALIAVAGIASPAMADVPCTPFTTTIVSDTSTTVDIINGGGNAVAVAVSGAWTASIPGATWVWESPANEGTVAFESTFSVPGTIVSATLDIATDNTYTVSLNGNAVGADANPVNFTLGTQDNYNVALASFVGGVNTLRAVVTNQGGAPELPLNPAGLLFKLVVQSEVCDKCCGGDDKVKNSNDATVDTEIISLSLTGYNGAGGSSGGNGGRGGSIRNSGGTQDVDNSHTGSGGNGGNSGVGGTVFSGDATSSASLDNTVNDNYVEINRCTCPGTGCKGGDDVVRNRNNADVGSGLLSTADTGLNNADGSTGGEGGNGGKIKNSGGNQEDITNSSTGNGGTGGTSGEGGLVQSGNSASHTSATSVVNRNVVGIRR